MNATERARRSDSLYYGEVTRRTLCDMIAQLESDKETETCEMEYVPSLMSWLCKTCNMTEFAPERPKPRYCRWCGKRVTSWGPTSI